LSAHRLRDQQGAALILIIGVIAAVGALAAGLAVLTSNTLHATTSNVDQTKAFNLAEAGLQAGQAALQVNWPTSTQPSPAPSVAATAYPHAQVSFYDDNGNVASPGIDMTSTVDTQPNNLMWVVSQATVGKRTAKVMAEVRRNTSPTYILTGVPVATSGHLTVNGTGNGNDWVIGYDAPATGGTVYDNSFTSNGNAAFQAPIPYPPTDGTTNTFIDDNIFPLQTVLTLTQIAQATRFTKSDGTTVTHDLSSWSAFTSMTSADKLAFMQSEPRVFVVENGNVDLKDIPNTDPASSPATVWSVNFPGALLVMNGSIGLSGGGQPELFGVLYTGNGSADFSGKLTIHGMIVARGSGATVSGARAIRYNQDVLANLNKAFATSVEQVQNTWRQVPVAQP
jgi:Tfp pilus assembly protein PilX